MKNLLRTFVLFSLLCSSSLLATPVNINKANAAKIAKSLSGIGLKKAQSIVDFRKQNGKFKTIDALMKVKGIGQATINKNKKDIRLK